jgi:hypothetical protein
MKIDFNNITSQEKLILKSFVEWYLKTNPNNKVINEGEYTFEHNRENVSITLPCSLIIVERNKATHQQLFSGKNIVLHSIGPTFNGDGTINILKSEWRIKPIKDGLEVKKVSCLIKHKDFHDYSTSSNGIETQKAIKAAEAKVYFAFYHHNAKRKVTYNQVIDGSHIKTSSYMVIPRIEGVTVREYIQDKKIISLEEAISIIGGCFAAIEQYHTKIGGHGDIHMDNFIINPNTGKVSIIDFDRAINYQNPENDICSMRSIITRILPHIKEQTTFDDMAKNFHHYYDLLTNNQQHHKFYL